MCHYYGRGQAKACSQISNQIISIAYCQMLGNMHLILFTKVVSLPYFLLALRNESPCSFDTNSSRILDVAVLTLRSTEGRVKQLCSSTYCEQQSYLDWIIYTNPIVEPPLLSGPCSPDTWLLICRPRSCGFLFLTVASSSLYCTCLRPSRPFSHTYCRGPAPKQHFDVVL